MKPFSILSFALFLFSFSAGAQIQSSQYFDGDSTDPWPIVIKIDSSRSNIWQIGRPQKSYFNSASSSPNAIITDTSGFYPMNDTSRFTAYFRSYGSSGRIRAIQWKQKIDFDAGSDGGMVEFSIDSGRTWQNAFNNPNVYKFYGFDSANFDTLKGGEYAFSGTDTTWRDVWLCFQSSSRIKLGEPFMLRFTILSDSINNDKEGWMIDNLLDHVTYIHTVVNQEKFASYFKIYPNPTQDILYLEAEKIPDFHMIEQMQLCDAVGQTLEEWTNIPTKFFIDVRKYQSGMYYLNITTNLQSKNYRFIIQRN